MRTSKHIVVLCITSSLIFGCVREVSNPVPESPSTNNATSSPTSSQSQLAQSTTSSAEKSGTFVAGEHETTGTVRMKTENGKRVLELDQSFKTSTSGPDLYVILHRSDNVLKSTKAPSYPLKEQDYAIVGRLQKYNGAQRYPIPDTIKLEDYQSAVIWCRMFNATFGTAKLNG